MRGGVRRANRLVEVCLRFARGWFVGGAFAAVAALTAGCGGGADTASAPPPSEATPAQGAAGAERTATDGAPEKLWSGQGIVVRALVPVAVRRITWSLYEFDYRVLLQNDGPAVDGVTARLVAPPHGVQVLDDTIAVGSLAANSFEVPRDTITVRKRLIDGFLLRPHEWQITFGPPVLTGTVAVGAALAQANVEVTDMTKANVCQEAPVVTTSTGGYTCTVLAGRTAPFVVTVTDRFAAYPPMVSIVPVAPAAGTTLVANVTPLTTAIVSQLAPNGDALAVRDDRALIDLTALAAITANVLAQIQPVLAALGGPPGYDPFTTQIVAATPTQSGNTADAVIEALRISRVNGVTRIATVDNPAGSVPLAGATTTSPPLLPAPSPTLLGLAAAQRIVLAALNECFALPVSMRVLAVDPLPANEGGRLVTSMAPACAAIARADYLHGGYRLGQRLYGLLNDTNMVGARFQPAEIMLFVDDTTAADADSAVLNFRYVDSLGTGGNLIEVARKFPGSATPAHASDWWLHGNQRPVDLSIRAMARRLEQFAPNPGTAPFVNAASSRFETGLVLFVNKDGPQSAGMRAARVTGPGLPTAGVVLTRPDPAFVTDQTWLNIRNKTGATEPAAATPAGNTGNIFILQRTQGITGAAATAVRPNPNAGNSNNTQFVIWAHPLDYPAVPAGQPYIDFAQLGPHNVYTFEIYYDGDTAPRHTLTTSILTAVLPATTMGGLRWHELTPATLGYLAPGDPLAAEQATMNLAWFGNPFAETVGDAGVYTFGEGRTVIDGIVPVPRGATSATATAPGGSTFPPLLGDGISRRTLQLRYRMLDGSYKDTLSLYN